MGQKLIYQAVGYASVNSTLEEGNVYFSNEEATIQYISKYLRGEGYVRPRFVTGKKVYKTLEEYEDDKIYGNELN